MMNVCRACKSGFQTEKIEDSICPDCFKTIEGMLKEDKSFKDFLTGFIKNDEALRYEFLEIVLSDEKMLTRIGKALLSIKAKEIGLGAPGSLAEFFRTEGDAETS
jgi:hypothetical protein